MRRIIVLALVSAFAISAVQAQVAPPVAAPPVAVQPVGPPFSPNITITPARPSGLYNVG